MHPLVTCILPVRGRPEQTVQVAARLLETAGDVPAEWIVSSGADDHDICQEITIRAGAWRQVGSFGRRLTYWQALALATEHSSAPILCCLANDLAPERDWLANGVKAYAARFGGLPGLMGFEGDGHPVHHSCHFLIGRALLAELGGWPVHYDHNYGDAELCLRAQALNRYGKARRAVLRHLHPALSAAQDDAVYREGRAQWHQDRATFERRAHLWTS